MPDDPLATNTPPEPRPEPRAKNVTCEFCQSTLAANGDYLRMGEKAKRFRSLEEENEKLQARIVQLQDEIRALKERTDTPPTRTERRGGVGMFS